MYDSKLSEYESAMELRAKEIDEYNVEQESYEASLRGATLNFEEKMKEYEKQEKLNKEIMQIRQSEYLDKYADYQAEVLQIKSFRSELWDRARMCTRCGTTYLGDR